MASSSSPGGANGGGVTGGGGDAGDDMDVSGAELDANKNEKMFTLKKWNAVAMWSWDVECDTCAICRVQVMGKWTNVIIIFLYTLTYSLFSVKFRKLVNPCQIKT